MSFDLVYVLLWEHIKLPLVSSQTFDQAQKQTEVEGALKPGTVSVWVMTPLRFYIGREERSIVKRLKLRCPGIKIHLLPEVNRLDNFPLTFFLKFQRGKLLASKVVFHFRGEATLNHFVRHYSKRTNDSFILDVRGYWPAEILYARGVEDIGNLSKNLAAVHDHEKRKLQKALALGDGVIAVSQNLANLLNKIVPGLPEINVVPCSVRSVHGRHSREKIRQSLGVADDEKLLVYSGGYARYQHLEDLTIPFIELILKQCELVKVLILSQDMLKIQQIVKAATEYYDRYIFCKVDQIEVGDYLSACDLGFLLRRESLVNTVAQPVKIGEYLAAGIPVCVQGEVGGVTEKLISYNAGLSVDLVDQDEGVWLKHSYKVLNFLKSNNTERAQLLARDYFVWDRNVVKQRQYYRSILISK
ncbi:MAG: hypothetical protein KF717_12085 [Cyclobacteriaceae bacterium]|nr:hypothetical protein [Cyclobacteriaceae bacterium]MCB9236648.1 hypothetical protein [Flammeovirgaceae bacterium]